MILFMSIIDITGPQWEEQMHETAVKVALSISA
jgi:hypothetical protein